MAGVAHIPHLEKRPSGYFFRRRLPRALREIADPVQKISLCFSLRTDVICEAKILVARLSALTDLGFALVKERPVQHLSAEHVSLLNELARFQIAAHEALRASAEPRSEAAANFAAQSERATQDMLRRALALGDRTPVVEPLRDLARHFGVSLDESSTDWRALAFEALRVMLDVSREREKREVGSYAEPTPIFRSVMASRSASPPAALPVVAAQSPVSSLAIPSAAASAAISIAVPNIPAATTTSAPEAAANLPAPTASTTAPTAPADTSEASPEPPTPTSGSDARVVTEKDDETAFRIKMRPPLLENIDLRDLSPEMRNILRTKPRGITLLEGIQLKKELKCAGYQDDFSIEQTGDKKAGKKWKSNSGSKANVAEKFWVEFVGDVPFEDVDRDDIRDALKILPDLPLQHSKGTDKFVAKNGFRVLVDEIDAEEERAEKDALKALGNGPEVTEADREKARLDARIPRLRAETRSKHRGYIKSVGKMLYDLQLIDRNPFEICGVPNKLKDQWKKSEEKRKRICWDDRFYILLRSPVFQGPFDDPGEPFYWIPLIARLMGLREEEACQLGPEDFGTDKGISYLDVKVLDANNVKTEESQRRMPVHPTLIELGLLKLVDLRCKQGKHRLFVHLTRGQTKGTYSENFSKNFTYYRKKHQCYWEGLDLHAMRTSFNSDLMNQDKSDAIRCVLLGHDPVDEGAKSYAQGLSLRTLYERICDVEIDVSMIARPFGETAVERGKVVGIRSVQD
ncbi:hypothetical protein BMI91_00055 [Thioclava sediminum]|uniref:DUF6538 domain-containing protein n=1 Tax=Thioclava sediminum TaxID=1915319 RepID=A0ABX3MYZ8_9RHOB|nr:DUF6538 domain-containing protein [Thioclava sediminum]OOY24885.1 hypothetical protein BMI91_00055 [Thioclava sediminum]